MTVLRGVLLISQFQSQITSVDWVVVAIYFSILLSVAWWVVRRGKDSAADYFLASIRTGKYGSVDQVSVLPTPCSQSLMSRKQQSSLAEEVDLLAVSKLVSSAYLEFWNRP